jgi:DNA-binding response OmpR family regulator
MANSLLDKKKVLIVDDEPDVLETLKELLSMCEVTEAATFERAKELLETQVFDIAVLDIMGVDGYRLLEIARQKKSCL